MTAVLPEWIADHSVDQAVTVAMSPLWGALLVDCNQHVWALRFLNLTTACLFISSEGLDHKAYYVSDHRRFDQPVIVCIRKG